MTVRTGRAVSSRSSGPNVQGLRSLPTIAGNRNPAARRFAAPPTLAADMSVDHFPAAFGRRRPRRRERSGLSPGGRTQSAGSRRRLGRSEIRLRLHIFGKIHTKLAAGRRSGDRARLCGGAFDYMAQGAEGLQVGILIDDHRQDAGLEIVAVVVREFVRYPACAAPAIELLQRVPYPRRTGAAVVNSREAAGAQRGSQSR